MYSMASVSNVHNQLSSPDGFNNIHLHYTDFREMPLQCTRCPRVFNSKQLLIAHLQEHVSVKYLQCNLCHYFFASPYHLDQHKIQFHRMDVSNVLLDTISNKNNISFVCYYCEKAFNTKEDLYSHLIDKCAVLSGENIYAASQNACHATPPNEVINRGVKRRCANKNVKNSRQSRLMRDSECHTRSYECDKCHVEFTFRDNLIMHQCIMHNVDEIGNAVIAPMPISRAVFKCVICNRPFPSYSELVDHENAMHSDNKHYDCIICYQSFSSREVLVYHIEMHTGNKPCVCNICDAIFLLPSFLEKHVRENHKV